MDLSKKKCIPCEGGIPALKEKEIGEFKKYISDDWKVVDNVKITKEFFFVSYRHTIDFVNKIADIAEEEGHHPVFLHAFLRHDFEEDRGAGDREHGADEKRRGEVKAEVKSRLVAYNEEDGHLECGDEHRPEA